MRVPIERSETIHFLGYPAEIARCPSVRLEAARESGYFGAMRARIPVAAIDPLEPAMENLAPSIPRDTAGARWVVETPRNIVSIRSGVTWERCGLEQMRAFREHMKLALD